jgi:hypothetical protein
MKSHTLSTQDILWRLFEGLKFILAGIMFLCYAAIAGFLIWASVHIGNMRVLYGIGFALAFFLAGVLHLKETEGYSSLKLTFQDFLCWPVRFNLTLFGMMTLFIAATATFYPAITVGPKGGYYVVDGKKKTKGLLAIPVYQRIEHFPIDQSRTIKNVSARTADGITVTGTIEANLALRGKSANWGENSAIMKRRIEEELITRFTQAVRERNFKGLDPLEISAAMSKSIDVKRLGVKWPTYLDKVKVTVW